MSNKTPFEIRLELLGLAQNILDQKHGAERDQLMNDWVSQRDDSIRDNLTSPPTPNLPFSKPEEIINLAKELNNFVSNG